MRATSRPRTVIVALFMSIFTIAWAACSDDAETDPDAACQKLANATCSKIDSCSPIYLGTLYEDVASCTTRTKASCLKVQEAPGTQISPAQISACADATSTRSCEQLQDPAPPSACKPTPGTLVDGAACAVDHQCVGAYCKQDIGGVCGVCSKRVAAGESCEWSADCDHDLACRNQACVTYVAAGGACDKDKPCRSPLACVNGACSKPGGAGTACDPVAQNCDSLAGLFCKPTTSPVCEKVQVANAGEPCGLLSAGYTVCKASGRCNTGGGATGTCMGAAKDGDTCDLLKGPSCTPPASCQGGVCKLHDPSACK